MKKLILLFLFYPNILNAGSSLNFGGNTSDIVDFGSPPQFNDLPQWTHLTWACPTTLTPDRRFMTKGVIAAGQKYIRVPGGATGNVGAFVDRVVDTIYVTNDQPLANGLCNGVAVTFDVNAVPVAHIYTWKSTSTPVESTYATSTNGSGLMVTEAVSSLFIGNRGGTPPANSFQGSIGVVMQWNRVLSREEIANQSFAQFPSSGCILYSHLGWNGDGTQIDESGAGADGTVSGAISSSNGPPIFFRGAAVQ